MCCNLREVNIGQFTFSNSLLSSLSLSPSVWNYDCNSNISAKTELNFLLRLDGKTIPNNSFKLNFPGWNYSFNLQPDSQGNIKNTFQLLIQRNVNSTIEIVSDLGVSLNGLFVAYYNHDCYIYPPVKICLCNAIQCMSQPVNSNLIGSVSYSFTSGQEAQITFSDFNALRMNVIGNLVGLPSDLVYTIQGCGKLSLDENVDVRFPNFNLRSGLVGNNGNFQFNLQLDLTANPNDITYSDLIVATGPGELPVTGTINVNFYTTLSPTNSISVQQIIVPANTTYTLNFNDSINSKGCVTTIPAFAFVGDGMYTLTIGSVSGLNDTSTPITISLIGRLSPSPDENKITLTANSENVSLVFTNRSIESGLWYNITNLNNYDVTLNEVSLVMKVGNFHRKLATFTLSEIVSFSTTLNNTNLPINSETTTVFDNKVVPSDVYVTKPIFGGVQQIGSFLTGRCTCTLGITNNSSSTFYYRNYIVGREGKLRTVDPHEVSTIDFSLGEGDIIWFNSYVNAALEAGQFVNLTVTLTP